MPHAALHKDLFVKHSITVKYDASVDTTGKVAVAALPQGAIPCLSSSAFVATAFNGTSPTVKVGILPRGGTLDDDALFTSADIAPATAAFKPAVAATLLAGFATPLTAAADIVLTTGGTSVTTGVVYVTIDYIVDTATLPLGY